MAPRASVRLRLSITVAEDAKEAAILDPEGERQAAILKAEGLAQTLEKSRSSARASTPIPSAAPVPRDPDAGGDFPVNEDRGPMAFRGLLHGWKGFLPTEAAAPPVARAPAPPAPLASAVVAPSAASNAGSNGASNGTTSAPD